MMSLEVIVAQNDKATVTARKQKLTPYVAVRDHDTGVKASPRLGYLVPKGWEYVQEFFVDTSGLGAKDEPALTFDQLLIRIKKGYGYGLGEMGQFQGYIREYKRI